MPNWWVEWEEEWKQVKASEEEKGIVLTAVQWNTSLTEEPDELVRQ